MPEIRTTLQSVFVKNRTEELGYDVWENFVIPPFFNSLDLHEAKKPRVIIGGRGYGKTMLLRYLSHYSTFSQKRNAVSLDDLGHIGLYWRPDTQFVSVMCERGSAEDTWISAFQHLLAIDLGKELLSSVNSIVNSNLKDLEKGLLDQLHFDGLDGYGVQQCSYFDLDETLTLRQSEFETWVNNARSLSPPVFLPGASFLKQMIRCIKNSSDILKEVTFYVYIDEFENLLEYQQRIINTNLKHSEIPLIFNLAMKRNGFKIKKTLGEESIVDVADYRTHDIDEYLTHDKFKLFAAEVLLLHFAIANYGIDSFDINILRDPDSIQERHKGEYKKSVLQHIDQILPTPSNRELASKVFQDDSLKDTLSRKIKAAIKKRSLKLDCSQFMREHLPEASIVSSSLLYRDKLSPEEIIDDLNKLENNKNNKFTGKTDWIHNNFIGSLLNIYSSHLRVCPFYAGFDTFCRLARGNLRHFLELCHISLNQLPDLNSGQELQVSHQDQAVAARQVSAKFLNEITHFGKFGTRLHTFVLRLGSIFALSHDNPAQSEPERSHFAIVRGTRQITDGTERLLQEAIKWSVLFDEKETKIKGSNQPYNIEYVLNPIYAPYFNITYRKKRKLELSSDELLDLIEGDYEKVRSLLSKYSRKWSVAIEDSNPTLFSHLQEG